MEGFELGWEEKHSHSSFGVYPGLAKIEDFEYSMLVGHLFLWYFVAEGVWNFPMLDVTGV